MKKEDFVRTSWGFNILPFFDKGIICILNGGWEFTDSNGYRIVKRSDGKRFMVSHLIYAVGKSFPKGYVVSLKNMKNFTIKYKDGDRSNCNFENLICIPKKSYQKLLKFNKMVGREKS